jgi:integrase
MVLAFLSRIEQDRGNSPATRNLRLAAIKAFMRYVEFKCPSALEQVARINAIPGKRDDQKLIRHLTMAEVRAVLDAPSCVASASRRPHRQGWALAWPAPMLPGFSSWPHFTRPAGGSPA